MNTINDFTVIATSFNDEKNMIRFLDGFNAQTIRPKYVLIVDGGSTDETETIVKKQENNYPFKIEMYFKIGRLNIAQGYNEAIRRSKTEWMIIAGIGNDYSPDFCESLLKEEKRGEASIVYSKIIANSVNAFSNAFNVAFVGGNKGKIYPMASNRGVLVSKKVFRQCGLFYENFNYAGEDMEFFAERIHQHDIQMQYAEGGVVYWDTPQNFTEYLKRSRVNAIADMQMIPKKKIIKHIVSRLIVIAFFCLSLAVKWELALLYLAAFYIAVWYKHRNFSFTAYLLRIHFLFLPMYYYIRNWKYTKKEFHFNCNDIPRLDGRP